LGNYSKCRFSIYLKQVLFDWNYNLAFEIVDLVNYWSNDCLWLSELITDYGLGNGASLLIYTNIISSLPNLSRKIFLENKENFTIFFRNWNYFINFYFFIWNCFLQEGVRIIPLISSKQLNQSSLQDSVTSNNYIPLRFNQAGVMPIILTTAILVVPNYISN
jgi:preprotein translocase subunit SecY